LQGVKRYTIPIPEVVEVAKWAFENKMGTIMLQVLLQKFSNLLCTPLY
jgi:hypothetical protein